MSSSPKRPKLDLKEKAPADSRVMKRIEDLFAPHFESLKTLVPISKTKTESSTLDTLPTLETRTEEATPPLPLAGPVSHEPPRERTKVGRVSKKQDLRASRAALALLVIAGIVIGWALNSQFQRTEIRVPTAQETSELNKMRERAQFHRVQTGQRLNRERIGVEVENMKTAPSIPSGASAVEGRNMMVGLPLMPEGHHRKSDRDRLRPVDSDYADARVAYSVRDERAAKEWEEHAQKAYVEEFIANAARAGLKVKVDDNGMVQVIGRRPDSVGNKLPGDKGSIR